MKLELEGFKYIFENTPFNPFNSLLCHSLFCWLKSFLTIRWQSAWKTIFKEETTTPRDISLCVRVFFPKTLSKHSIRHLTELKTCFCTRSWAAISCDPLKATHFCDWNLNCVNKRVLIIFCSSRVPTDYKTLGWWSRNIFCIDILSLDRLFQGQKCHQNWGKWRGWAPLELVRGTRTRT